MALQIMEDIEHYDIPIYNFPYDIEEDDEDTVQDNSELRVRNPIIIKRERVFPTKLYFTGNASLCNHWLWEEVEIEGELVRARIYPWGIVEVDNPKHSDFSRLRTALLSYVEYLVQDLFDTHLLSP
jgi:cell division control protein 11